MIIDMILNNTPPPIQITSPSAIYEKYIPESSTLKLTIPNINNIQETFNRQYCPPILDQEHQNSCSANTVTYMIEYYQKRNLCFTTPLSAEALYYWTRELEGSQSMDAGVRPNDTFDLARDVGVPSEKFHSNSRSNEFVKPSDIATKDASLNKINGWKQLDFSGDVKKSDVIAERIANGDVVGICIYESQSLYSPNNGIVDVDVNSPLLKTGHEIMVVDYKTDKETGKRLFLCENSWGIGYGLNGFVWLTEDYVNQGCYFAGTILFGNVNNAINSVNTSIAT
jgi:C1A family cysteine protease